MSQTPERIDPSNLFDPFGFWKQTQQTALDSWSKTMTEAVNTDAYSEATGRMLDNYLTVSAPLRKIVEQTMTQLLGQLNLPSRAEVVSLAERMTNIELRLDDLDVRMDELLRVAQRTASAVAALNVLTTLNTQAVNGEASGNVASDASMNGQAPSGRRTPTRRRSARSDQSAPAQTTGASQATPTIRAKRGTRATRANGTTEAK